MKTAHEVFEAYLKLSHGEKKQALKLFASALAEQPPEEGIGPPPLPPKPGDPPQGP